MTTERRGGGLGDEDKRLGHGSPGSVVAARRWGSRTLRLPGSDRPGVARVLLAIQTLRLPGSDHPGVARIKVTPLGVMGRMSRGIRGGSAAGAREHVGSSSDTDRWLAGHSHVRTRTIATKEGEKGMGLLTVQGTCQ